MRPPDQAHIDRLQRVVGNRRNAEFAVAVRARNAALEKGALVDDVEPLCGMRRQTDCEPS